MCVFDPRNPEKKGEWGDYIKGVVSELLKRGIKTGGFNAAVSSTLPVGIGLSSSAALEVATAFMLKTLYPYDMESFAIAKLCRAAENEFVGMNCGILDQFSSIFGRNNGALFLDCRTEEHEVLPLSSGGIKVVICNSMKTHKLISSQYNVRREECFNAAQFFGRQDKDVVMLRDVTVEMFEQVASGLSDNERKRARHIIYENERVLKGRQALHEGDLQTFGSLMNESHASSKNWFDNSTPELDILQETAVSVPGVIGAKLSGGGFGGCIVALAEETAVEPLKQILSERYKRETGIIPDIYCAEVSDGARVIA
ncbi:galactokinase [Planctomycetota bacterium]